MKKNQAFNLQKLDTGKNFPTGVWVDSRKQKPPLGEEVLLTNGDGTRDIGEFFPGSGWTGHKYTWNELSTYEDPKFVFWSRIPEDPISEISKPYRGKR